MRLRALPIYEDQYAFNDLTMHTFTNQFKDGITIRSDVTDKNIVYMNVNGLTDDNLERLIGFLGNIYVSYKEQYGVCTDDDKVNLDEWYCNYLISPFDVDFRIIRKDGNHYLIDLFIMKFRPDIIEKYKLLEVV